MVLTELIDQYPLLASSEAQTIVNQKGANAKMLAMKFGQHTFLEFLN